MLVRKSSIAEMLISGLLVAATASLVLAILVLSGVPPVDRDALTHHLAVPKLYLKYGGISRDSLGSLFLLSDES